MDTNELARIAYSAFGAATDFRGPLGDPLPSWDALPPYMKDAFAKTATAVLDANNTPLAVPAGSVDSVLPFDDVEHARGANWHMVKVGGG